MKRKAVKHTRGGIELYGFPIQGWLCYGSFALFALNLLVVWLMRMGGSTVSWGHGMWGAISIGLMIFINIGISEPSDYVSGGMDEYKGMNPRNYKEYVEPGGKKYVGKAREE